MPVMNLLPGSGLRLEGPPPTRLQLIPGTGTVLYPVQYHNIYIYIYYIIPAALGLSKDTQIYIMLNLRKEKGGNEG